MAQWTGSRDQAPRRTMGEGMPEIKYPHHDSRESHCDGRDYPGVLCGSLGTGVVGLSRTCLLGTTATMRWIKGVTGDRVRQLGPGWAKWAAAQKALGSKVGPRRVRTAAWAEPERAAGS